MRLEAQLQVIEGMAEDKAKAIQKEKFDLEKRLANIAEAFIRRRKMIVYGGSAINAILPAHARFYGKDQISDYDCYSIHALKDAHQLADELYRRGFKYVNVKRAIHDGTFKVSAEFVTVADITRISKGLYARLLELSKKDYDLKTLPYIPAPTYFLRFAMFNELSKPRESTSRWAKIYTRLKLLMTHVPLKLLRSIGTFFVPSLLSEDEIQNVTKTVLRNAHKRFPVGGLYMIESYLAKKSIKFNRKLYRNTIGIIDMLSLTAEDTAETMGTAIVAAIKGKDATLRPDLSIGIEFRANKHLSVNYMTMDGEPMETPILLPEYIIYATKGKRRLDLLTIYDGRFACKSVITRGGLYQMTIDSIISILYGRMIASSSSFQEVSLKEMAARLENIAEEVSKENLKLRLSTECYGESVTVERVRRQRWDDKVRVVIYIPEDALGAPALGAPALGAPKTQTATPSKFDAIYNEPR